MKMPLATIIDDKLLEQLRDAAHYLPGATITGLVEDALRRELARLERAHGKPFPKRGK